MKNSPYTITPTNTHVPVNLITIVQSETKLNTFKSIIVNEIWRIISGDKNSPQILFSAISNQSDFDTKATKMAINTFYIVESFRDHWFNTLGDSF